MNYTVMPGDTMYEIATRFGISLDAILQANPNIGNPDLIYPGQVIVIPTMGVPGEGTIPGIPGLFPVGGAGAGAGEIPDLPGLPDIAPGGMLPGFLPGGTMPGFFPGGMMPGFAPEGKMPCCPPSGMIPVFPPGNMGAGGEGMMPCCPPTGMMPVFPPGTIRPGRACLLKMGDRGDEVKHLQQRLKDLGYYNGSITGNFGFRTKNAVKRFQKDCHVETNGIADWFLLQTMR